MNGKLVFLCVFFLSFSYGFLYAGEDIFSSAEVGYGFGVDGDRSLVITSVGLKDVSYVKFHLGGLRYTEESESPRETGFIGVDAVIDAHTFLGCLTSWCPMNRLGVGISYFDNPTENFGSKWEFHVLAKMGVMHENGNFYLLGGVDHWSTAGLTEKNDGETFFVFSAGFLF